MLQTIREYKLEELKNGLKKVGYYNIRCIKWEGKEVTKFSKEVEVKWLRLGSGQMHLVLHLVLGAEIQILNIE